MRSFLEMKRLPLDQQVIAILYQALAPLESDGLRKEPKPGGYSDSGADIGYCLRRHGIQVATPVPDPDRSQNLAWVFPDTEDGITDALRHGATLLWANTVLFEGHPIEKVMDRCWIVGQLPAAMQAADDKYGTNLKLRKSGLPVASSILVGEVPMPGVFALHSLNTRILSAQKLTFPLIVKPVRGRGSQGVSLAVSLDELIQQATELIQSGRFGSLVIIEQFLSGDELTITVMPDKSNHAVKGTNSHFWALPPVLRFNHDKGIAPYNGAVAVTRNSRALTINERQAPEVSTAVDACLAAAKLVNARAPIRIDCRADGDGELKLFDLNMKPNMTGAGRPGREDQDSLSLIAARAIGWDYLDFLRAMAQSAW
jgi:hypothetical protein